MIESICIIPARGGSKRIPKKNIKNFLGKPIITYSIQTAQKSRIFDEIYVSSDSQEILQIAKNEGVKTIKRPENLSQDYTSTQEVILHAIHLLNLHQSWVCCLYATAPLLDAKTLQEAFKKRDKTCYLFSAVEYSYSPYRAFKIQDDKNIMLFPDLFSKRSQDLQKIYHDAGQFYFAKGEIWQKKSNIFEDSISFTLSNLEVQDIDTPEDWDIAEMKYRLKFKI